MVSPDFLPTILGRQHKLRVSQLMFYYWIAQIIYKEKNEKKIYLVKSRYGYELSSKSQIITMGNLILETRKKKGFLTSRHLIVEYGHLN